MHHPAGEAGTATLEGASRPVRLLDQLRTVIRYRHYSYRTEQAYVGWVRRFIRFHGCRHPNELGGEDVVAFLTQLAVDRNVSASTHPQALSAILFLYREVLAIDLPWLGEIEQPRKPRRLPVVLSRDEARREITVPSGKGGRDRMTMLPTALRHEVETQLVYAK
ncbi:MAG: phage integrase N-terminal SAM-like domain-containing protein [Burkholderiales bacterium]|nr:phage integrase N-terminal SAM-like domain-containing protein [Burkholderiales bacterium]